MGLWRGPFDEIIMDNAAFFRLQEFRLMLASWKVQPYHKAAYRPSGNSIVERHYCRIKSLAERSAISPIEAVYWYNVSPRIGQQEVSVTHISTHICMKTLNGRA